MNGLRCAFRTAEKGRGCEKGDGALYTIKAGAGTFGKGFLFMEAFMDEVTVESEPGKGTAVTLKKRVRKGEV